MIEIKSKSFCDYYSNTPYEYDLKYIHYNIDVNNDTDVTVASYGYYHNDVVNMCLVCDDDLMYKANCAVSHVCNENYNKDLSR